MENGFGESKVVRKIFQQVNLNNFSAQIIMFMHQMEIFIREQINF